jgi:iron-sulfur cluster assembly 2
MTQMSRQSLRLVSSARTGRTLTPVSSTMSRRAWTTRYSTQVSASTPSNTPSPLIAPTPSHGSTTAILNPRTSDAGTPLNIDITPRAANRLTQIMAKDCSPTACLRVTVESGGCHGFQYLMKLSNTAQLDRDEDTLFIYQQAETQNQARELGEGLPKVVMDRASLELLEGSKVDFTMELIGSQFKIADNPRATSSCGCGTSFDVKTNLDKDASGALW